MRESLDAALWRRRRISPSPLLVSKEPDAPLLKLPMRLTSNPFSARSLWTDTLQQSWRQGRPLTSKLFPCSKEVELQQER